MAKKHEPKAYTHICNVYGMDFVGFKMPVGAVYGRKNDTFYVSLYRNIRRGSMPIYVKVQDEDWTKKMFSVNSHICQAVLDCVEGQSVVVGTYRNPDAKHKKHKKPDQAESAPLSVVEADGKKYRAIPYEMTLPDRIGSKNLCSITPNMRGANYEFTARMRPDRATYGVEYAGTLYIFRGTEEAEKFCHEKHISTKGIKQEFLYSEASAISYNQVTECAYWKNLSDATSGKASVVAAHFKGWDCPED